MPTLVIHHSDQTRGIVLTGRLLIGRVPPVGLVVPDAEVSRIHAWIDRVGDRYYVADADSRSGTIVEEYPIAGRHTLRDGDEIKVGAATIVYRDEDELPGDVTRLKVPATNGVAEPAAGGILFACGCGAPLWAPLDWVGRRGKCAHCGQRTPVPALDPTVAPPRTVAAKPFAARPASNRPASPTAVAAKPAPTRLCSICQWAIEAADSQASCPSCHLTFHSECWEENKGCSAYGCASVAALEDPAMEPQAVAAEAAVEEHHERFPVEFAMLGGSVICSLIGLLAFGVPSALLAVCTSAYWVAQRRRGESLKNGIVAAAMAMCITGICAGLWFSAIRWLHRPLAAPWQHVS
jgi:pSer/pThr/pTyr-binding forkhead associated (FHA) protein